MKEVVVDLDLISVQILQLVMTLGMQGRGLVLHLLHRKFSMVPLRFQTLLGSLRDLSCVVAGLLSDIIR